MNIPKNIRALGIPWFRADTWPRLLEIAGDREELFDRFEDWEKYAEARFAELKAEGVPVEKVYIDPDELLAWCRARGRKVEAGERAEFAAFVLAQHYRCGH